MIIGITGGIGSGKSTILNILKEEHNAHIFEADKIAKELMNPGGSCYQAVVESFGREILLPPDEIAQQCFIDRDKLSSIVFKDDSKRELLNSLTHPRVTAEILDKFQEVYSNDPEALIVVETAILIEVGYKKLCDATIAVLVDREERISRLMKSRGYSREKCENIMATQLSDEQLKTECDFVIDNSGNLDDSRKQVREILKELERKKEITINERTDY